MIVDYNYKSYTQFINTVGATQYIPPAKNNRGLIFFSGLDNIGNQYFPQIVVSTPSGGTAAINIAENISGSFNDLFMQFKRETTTGVRSSDITMSYANNGSIPSFFPISYQYLIFAPTGSPTSLLVKPLIITLY